MKIYFLVFSFIFSSIQASLGWNHFDSLAIKQNKSHIFWDDIRSVSINNQGFELAFPILRLNSDEFINIEFDELNGDGSQYSYHLMHCNADWTTSEISHFDYIEGYNDLTIATIQNSLATIQSYVHYNFEFPNA